MSELIEFSVIENAFARYFNEHQQAIQGFFGATATLSQIDECRLIVFPEKMYDQFPALPVLIAPDGQRVFDDALPQTSQDALRQLSYLPNVVDYDEIDPEVFEVALPDGSVQSLFLVVLDVMFAGFADCLSGKELVKFTVSLNDQPPVQIKHPDPQVQRSVRSAFSAGVLIGAGMQMIEDTSMSNVTYATARGAEQADIDAFGTRVLSHRGQDIADVGTANRANSVSPDRTDSRGRAFQQARDNRNRARGCCTGGFADYLGRTDDCD